MYQLFTLASALLSLLALAPSPATSAPVNITSNLTKRAPNWGFPYGSEKIRGVNLGGWLVLEAWLTPSLFVPLNDNRIVDEYTFCQYQDYNTAHNTLVNHWDTWITLNDFQAIKNAGLNHVRLPIGYWAWDVSRGEPYHQGQLFYLEQAVSWARTVGLKIMLDLHGLPGSQNGFDNSGQATNTPSWHTDKNNVARSLSVIRSMASWYSSRTDVVSAIEAVNEPAGWQGTGFMNTLRQYYYDSYGSIRYPYGTGDQAAAVTVIADAFQGPTTWNGFMTSGFDGVMMDTHYYGVFDNTELRRTGDQQIQAACSFKTTLAQYNLWTVVGEWSTASTDCAGKAYLPSSGGIRYEGTFPGSTYIGSCDPYTGSGANFSQDYKTFMRKFFEAQTEAFETGVGWLYWAWKTETTDEWSYSAGLQYGWIPQDPTDRAYPGICTPSGTT